MRLLSAEVSGNNYVKRS